MCGIAGVIAARGNVGEQSIRRMVAALSHRGPDDCGIKQIRSGQSDVWLGNTRLAILDLSAAGHQPMEDPETGNWIVYNGEAYNFQEIKKNLQARGMVFRSDTDTEVVLKAYGAFGRSYVNRLRGMFAFAIWDARAGELFLCRDRIGKKPLYYCAAPAGVFSFASEVRALLASGIPERKLDPEGLEIFLTNGFLVSPHTLVAGIRSLLPGHLMRVAADGRILENSRYWRLPASSEHAESDQILSRARREIAQAVRLRLVSDVPVGAFLSGGLDSSTVVALMKEAGGEVRTFSVTFQEDAYDESAYSRWVAHRFETQHTEVQLTQKEFSDLLPAALAAMDQPTFDGVNTYCVAQAARNSGLKVALSGMGSDELFGGYPFFNWIGFLAKSHFVAKRLPTTTVQFLRNQLLRNRLRGLSGIWKTTELLCDRKTANSKEYFLISAYQTAQTLFPSWVRCFLCAEEVRVPNESVALGLPREFLELLLDETAGEDDVSAISKLALRLFLGERCLRDTDTMSMGVSLEVRAPFTDHAFVETLLGYSGKIRCQGAPNKPLLQQLVKPFLGEDYPWRTKQGFIFPFQEWLQDGKELEHRMKGSENAKICKDIGLNHQAVRRLFTTFQERQNGIPWSRVWAIAVLLEWCRRHRVYR